MRVFIVVDAEDTVNSIHETLAEARHFALVEHPALYANSPWIKAPAMIAEAEREAPCTKYSRKDRRNILVHKACAAFHALNQ